MAWLGTYAYRIPVVAEYTHGGTQRIDATLSAFPVVIHISAACGIGGGFDASCVFDELENDANALKIALTTGETTECSVEIEGWDDANEQAWLHAAIPTVSHTEDTQLYLYYDKNHAASTKDNSAGNKVGLNADGSAATEAVWDANHKLVYHMVNDNGNVDDSTSNGNDGTKANTPTEAAAKIGKGQHYWANNDGISSNANLAAMSNFTLEAWVAFSNAAGGTNDMLFAIPTNDPSVLRVADEKIKVYADGGLKITSFTLIDNTNWHHIAIMADGTNIHLYIDGAEESTSPALYGGDSANNKLWVGDNSVGSDTFAGTIDEVRASNTNRSAAWIKATYYSGDDNLLTWGSEESKSIFGTATLSGIGTVIAKGIGIFIGKATLSGIGTVIAKGIGIFIGKATLSGIGNLIASAKVTSKPEIPYILEVRTTAGDLLAILENAYHVAYTQQVNVPHLLKFSIPANDSKVSNITLANELWLRDYATGTILRKFRLQYKTDSRSSGELVTNIEALDYMSQLAASRVIDYTAGTVMTYIAQAAAYGGTIYAVAMDETHIFVGGATTQAVKKYLRSDMSLIATSPDYGGTIRAIVVDDTHVYVAGETTDRVRRYLKSDMTYVDQAADFGCNIYTLDDDDTHFFAAGDTADAANWYVRKYLKATMALTDTSPTVGNHIQTIKVDSTHVFVGSRTNTVRKYLKADMTYLTASPDYGGWVMAIGLDGDYVYAAGATTQTIRSYLKADLTLGLESPNYGGAVQGMDISPPYVYICGNTTQKIRRYLLLDLTYNDEGSDYGGIPIGLAVDSSYAFVGGTVTERVWKYTLFDTIDEVIDELLTYTMQTPVITKGTIAAAYKDLVRNIRSGSESILSILLTLQSMVGGCLEVDNARLLQWSETLGEDKGQQIRYKKNLIGIERDIDYTALHNRIYAYGYNPTTATRIKLSEVQDEDYVESAASQAAWGGIYVGSFTNFSIFSAATLLEWANELLADHDDPVITYRIDSIDLSQHAGFDFEILQLGSTVTIVDEDLGIDVSAIVVKIEYPDYFLNPQDMKIELSNVVRNVADTLTQLGGVQEQHDYLLAPS